MRVIRVHRGSRSRLGGPMRFNFLASSFVLLAACGGSSGPDVDYASQLVQGSWTCPSSAPFGAELALTASGKNLRAQWLPELIMTPTGSFAGDWPPDDGGGNGGDDDSGPAEGGDWSGFVTMTLSRDSLTPTAQSTCTVA